MQLTSPKSLTRLFRQLAFVPFLHNTWLTKAVKNGFGERIAQAELGHLGEICLIIESHLPMSIAYCQNCQARAVDLFGLYKVWDTEHNTGVLIYVNLCEKELELIADRGIDQKVTADYWQTLCQTTLAHFKAGNMEQGINELIDELGVLLKTHYPNNDHANELPNQPIYLR